MKKITILIADDHAVVRTGLAALLATESDFDVVGQARNGEEAVREAKRLKPDVVLMDLVMPKTSGAAATETLATELPETRVVILTSFGATEGIERALRAGATGALMKTDSDTTLVKTIRRVAAGEHVVSGEIQKLIKSDPPLPALTPRQREVLESLTRGLTNKDIAKQFGISANCVKLHLANIFTRLGAANRAEAISIALRHRLIRD